MRLVEQVLHNWLSQYWHKFWGCWKWLYPYSFTKIISLCINYAIIIWLSLKIRSLWAHQSNQAAYARIDLCSIATKALEKYSMKTDNELKQRFNQYMQLSCCQNNCVWQQWKIGCSQSSTWLLYTSQYLWFRGIILHRLRRSLQGKRFHANLQQNILTCKGTHKDQIHGELTCKFGSLLVKDGLFISLKEICNSLEKPYINWSVHSPCDNGIVQMRLRRSYEKRRAKVWIFQFLSVPIRSETFKSKSKLSILI